MRAAHQRRDASYDGVFYLGVKTTGVFCRPTCPARQALPRNIEYFAGIPGCAAPLRCSRAAPISMRWP
jgi:AraC family transcriptional regulator of adaptative response/methylated-DNA-[protein]-cysteine methyltransferase